MVLYLILSSRKYLWQCCRCFSGFCLTIFKICDNTKQKPFKHILPWCLPKEKAIFEFKHVHRSPRSLILPASLYSILFTAFRCQITCISFTPFTVHLDSNHFYCFLKIESILIYCIIHALFCCRRWIDEHFMRRVVFQFLFSFRACGTNIGYGVTVFLREKQQTQTICYYKTFSRVRVRFQ